MLPTGPSLDILPKQFLHLISSLAGTETHLGGQSVLQPVNPNAAHQPQLVGLAHCYFWLEGSQVL